MKSALTFNTEIDSVGRPVWYSVEGTIIDHDGEAFPVGESTFNFDRAFNTLTHYVHSFENVAVSYLTTLSKEF